jgi:hypothetical protein
MKLDTFKNGVYEFQQGFGELHALQVLHVSSNQLTGDMLFVVSLLQLRVFNA